MVEDRHGLELSCTLWSWFARSSRVARQLIELLDGTVAKSVELYQVINIMGCLVGCFAILCMGIRFSLTDSKLVLLLSTPKMDDVVAITTHD